MTLSKIDPQQRETKAILRLFETATLTLPLVDGQPFRWFAMNIPFNIHPDISDVKGDLDLIVCLSGVPKFEGDIPINQYRTMEVKTVSATHEKGVKSLKVGKNQSILKQLNKLREFGSPEVVLLELYIMEENYLQQYGFPNTEIVSAVEGRSKILKENRFGYKLLPFQHYEVDGHDYGLTVLNTGSFFKTDINVLDAVKENPGNPFMRLINYLEDFLSEESELKRGGYFNLITYCFKCKQLILLDGQKESVCYKCQMPLLDDTTTYMPMSKMG